MSVIVLPNALFASYFGESIVGFENTLHLYL